MKLAVPSGYSTFCGGASGAPPASAGDRDLVWTRRNHPEASFAGRHVVERGLGVEEDIDAFRRGGVPDDEA